jgi:hypothetical protein
MNSRVQQLAQTSAVSYKLQKESIFIAHPEFLLSQLQKCNTQQQIIAMLVVYSQTIKEKKSTSLLKIVVTHILTRAATLYISLLF